MNRYFFKDVFKIGYMCEPINGCSVGCSYCNAFRGAKRRKFVKTRQEWMIPQIDKIDVKIFEKELQDVASDIRDNKAINFIALCGVSDPFCNEKCIETFYLCKSIIEKHKLITRTLTKSIIPTNYKNLNPITSEIGISIDGYNLYNKQIEIGNIKKLKILKNKGFYVFVALHPLNLRLPLYKLQIILQKLIFVNQITFGILDKYKPDINKKQFNIAYKFSDYIANFCIENKITFLNGGYYFSKENKKRLTKIGIIKKLIF